MSSKPGSGTDMSFSIMALHLFTLFTFVVCRPIFTLLANHPEYLVANHMFALDVYVAVASLGVVVPLFLTGLVAAGGLFGKRIRLLVQTLICAGLAGVFTLHLAGVTRVIPDIGKLLLAAAAFVVFALLYFRKPQFQLLITALSPVIVVFPLLFLFDQNIQRVVQEENRPVDPFIQLDQPAPLRKPPIVMVVLDELPLVDLLNSSGDIDARRFPNFAAVAAGATWYKNATTVSYATQSAVPAILSGKRPQSRKLPIFSEYPNNLFTLLQGHYTFHVVEPSTRLFRSTEIDAAQPSPGAGSIGIFLTDMSIVFLHIVLPGKLSRFIPAIDDQWGGFLPVSVFEANQKNRVHKSMTQDRVQPLLSFISEISEFPAETVHFIHVMLPHRPLRYLPSGRVYTDENYVKGLRLSKDSTSKIWQGQQVLADRMHQRHLLQIAFIDNLLGQLISAMKAAGIFGESMLIVVADHGVSYQQDIPVRFPTPANFGEVAFVPLMIKYPSQDRAVAVEFNAETIDIVPTIADVLGSETAWEFDGQSLIEDKGRARREKTILVRNDDAMTYTESEYLAARQTALERNISVFSLDDPRSDLFHFGPGLGLVGAPVESLADARVRCVIHSDMAGQLGHSDLSKKFIPTGIEGNIECNGVNPGQLLLLVGVNGVVEGISSPYRYKDEILFNVILSDHVLRDGDNDIELFAIRKKAANEQLGPPPDQTRQ